jgi:hypothetical protein
MDLAPFIIWLKLIHVLGALALMLAHGASAAVAFKLRTERDRTRIGALVDLSGASLSVFYVALLVVLVAGILTGIAGGYWTSGLLWIWASLVVFLVIVGGMYAMASSFFRDVRHAIGMATMFDARRGDSPPAPVGEGELAELLSSPRPMAVAALGLIGIAVLVYLMVLKPF